MENSFDGSVDKDFMSAPVKYPKVAMELKGFFCHRNKH